MKITIGEAAALLGANEAGVYHWIEEAELPAQRIRGQYRINRIDLLESPLDRSWLTRVRNSTNAAPLRGAGHTHARISDEDFERLESHGQFASPSF